jgi:hypothetical protein
VADEHFGVLRSGDRRPHEGIRCHVCPSPDVVEVRGLRVSRPEQVFVELASLLGPRAAAYVRPRVDSPMETRLRLLLVLSGLPEPEVNLTIRDVDGTPLRRYDLCWPSVKVIVEYDGRHHADRVEQWESDLARREAIDNEEWRLLVVVSRGIYQNPGQTVDLVWRVLRSRNLAGLPARPADAWRAHFPGH